MHERSTDMQYEYYPPHLLTEGHWGEIPWQFYVEYKLPNIEAVTAVFGVVSHQNKLVLIRHHESSRGWEFPGGHREPEENIIDALWRELKEESGVISTSQLQYFGYKRVTPKQPIPRRNPEEGFYPFPHSYVPYYAVDANELDLSHLAADVAEVALVGLDKATTLLSPDQRHLRIAQYAISRHLITVER